MRVGKPFSRGSVAKRSHAIVAARQMIHELAMERVLDKRYKIVAPIGAGGSSQVYLAQDTALNEWPTSIAAGPVHELPW